MTTWHWVDGQLSPAQRNERPLIVDSWITNNGHTRAYDLHRERFTASCLEVGLAPDDLPDFLDAVVARIPHEGRYFPRIECSNTGDLSLLLRPAPTESRVAELQIRVDPRQAPQWKGPDLPSLMKLREGAVAQGGTDAVLIDSEGCVVETATAGVLWWEGDTLMTPYSPRVMFSVTATLVRRLAVSAGFTLGTARRTPAELAEFEVWCVNAVHPLRRVQKMFDENQSFHMQRFTDKAAAERAYKFRSELLAL